MLVFNGAKEKIAKLLNRTVGMCYNIIPVNVHTGSNINTSKTLAYEWFGGPSLRQILLEDQLRTNFEEAAYKRLAEAPLKIQLTICHKIPGVGTVLEGRVISKWLLNYKRFAKIAKKNRWYTKACRQY